ncbi:PadR family transcriptional regulator [Marinithermofilum abyssi]|uniref:PadR family transcriptional regulator n=1 Tax=Marinithermofilum abyssi TaxID=1571185 RepID=A0A8J2VBM0_9BACL|nr:PadR family transcriptional regulator [Marinithermofilum abyssi]GGE07776.1 PadR family transcriptional regulator [Marinithermofilum abyssi]
MALRYALLGLLSKSPATGYELNQQFKEKMIYFWHAHHTQIYRELAKMEVDNLVTSQIVKQKEYPDKKIYTIQKKGMEELLHWLLEEPPKPPSIKNDFFLRVSIFHLIPYNEAIQLLEKSKITYQNILEGTQMWREERFTNDGLPSKEQLGEYLTSAFGVRFAKNWIEWCDWAIDVLRRMKEKEERASTE